MDGSGPSKAALAWAVRHAELTHATVEAVTGWHIPTSYGFAALPGQVSWEVAAATAVPVRPGRGAGQRSSRADRRLARRGPAGGGLPWAWRFAGLLKLVTGAAGLAGEALLAAAPDGSLLRADPAVLADSPFRDWRAPGVLLAGLAVILLAWPAGPAGRPLSREQS